MKIVCPSCQHSAETVMATEGARVRCPSCGTEFIAQESSPFTVVASETPPENKPSYNQRMAPYGTALKNFFTGVSFSGRASRSEYWFAMTIAIPLGCLIGGVEVASIYLNSVLGVILAYCLSIPCVFLSYTLMARRLNDIDFPGWLAIIGFIASLIYGFLTLLISIDMAMNTDSLFSPYKVHRGFLSADQFFAIQMAGGILNALLIIPLSLFYFVCTFFSSKNRVTQHGPIPFCEDAL